MRLSELQHSISLWLLRAFLESSALRFADTKPDGKQDESETESLLAQPKAAKLLGMSGAAGKSKHGRRSGNRGSGSARSNSPTSGAFDFSAAAFNSDFKFSFPGSSEFGSTSSSSSGSLFGGPRFAQLSSNPFEQASLFMTPAAKLHEERLLQAYSELPPSALEALNADASATSSHSSSSSAPSAAPAATVEGAITFGDSAADSKSSSSSSDKGSASEADERLRALFGAFASIPQTPAAQLAAAPPARQPSQAEVTAQHERFAAQWHGWLSKRRQDMQQLRAISARQRNALNELTRDFDTQVGVAARVMY